MVQCPCCKYDTISEKGRFDLCYLCSWEDDGQDDPWADEIKGGPNSDYSLSEARFNFNRFHTMYRPSDQAFLKNRSPEIDVIKKELMRLLKKKEKTGNKNHQLQAQITAKKIEFEEALDRLNKIMDEDYKNGKSVFPPAIEGSRKWTQILVNQNTELLNKKLRETLQLNDSEKIDWISPLATDNYTEYFGQGYVDLLEYKLNVKLEDFWPRLNFPWSAIGKSSSGKLILVDAKSSLSDYVAYGANIDDWDDEKEVELTKHSLQLAKRFFMYSGTGDWLNRFHKYSSRLVNLYLLRNLNELDVYVPFIHYLNDVNGVSTVQEWEATLELLYSYFGISNWGRRRLQKYAPTVFIDVKELSDKENKHLRVYNPTEIPSESLEEIDLWLEFVEIQQNRSNNLTDEEKDMININLKRIFERLDKLRRKRYGITG